MKNLKKDIGDEEIRIIGSDKPNQRSSKKLWFFILLLFVAAGVCIGCYYLFSDSDNSVYNASNQANMQSKTMEEEASRSILPSVSCKSEPAYVSVVDTVVEGHPLTLLFPKNSTPVLEVGIQSFNDSTVALIVQAAGVRGDNGEIVGAFVKEGNLISKGKSKAGFCAIINGETIIGTALNTAYLEKATETGGYFFRQYPLVVEGQPIDNKPKGRSLRKALADMDGRICVVLTRDKLTFIEFAQTLAGLGVKNAIYLVGSTSYGFYKDSSGTRVDFGKREDDVCNSVNYMVWR